MYQKENMPKGKIVSLLLLALVLTLGCVSMWLYGEYNSIPTNSPTKLSINIKSDSTYKTIAKELQVKNAIKYDWIFLQKIGNKKFPSLGQYQLKLPQNVDSIITQIEKQSQDIANSNSTTDTKTLLIKEGETFDEIVDSIASLNISTLPDSDEIKKYAQTSSNFNRSIYQFLPIPLGCDYGASDCAKYYIEGYIYPATYKISTKANLNQIFEQFLNAFDKRVNPPIEDNNNTFYKAMILASVIEKESGYGTRNNQDIAVVQTLADERSNIASVFGNRINEGMKWQSNPTTHYGTDYRLCETTITIPNCVRLDDPKLDNMYNTYTHKTPIGPISNPSAGSIQAALLPSKTDYLFFIADKTGKTRFSQNYNQFLQSEQDIINGN